MALGSLLLLSRPSPGSSDGGGARGAAAAPPRALPPAPGPAPAPEGEVGAPEEPRAGPLVLPARRRTADADPLAALDPTRFEGNGRIRVVCETDGQVPFPDRWTLHVGPAAALIGAEHADTRVIEVTGGEREVLVESLPLGGYELRASAPLMNSDPAFLMLTKPQQTELSALLRLNAAGYISGSVLDEAGNPVEGFPIALRSASSGELRTVRTDVGGGYLFEDVVNGDYLMFVGDPKAPLRDPIDIAFRAPTLTMRSFEIPALCELELQVFDGGGLVVADALIQGWSKDGGRIEGRTDVYGRLRQRFLPAGEYSVIATADGIGRTRTQVALDPAEPARAELRFKLR